MPRSFSTAMMTATLAPRAGTTPALDEDEGSKLSGSVRLRFEKTEAQPRGL